MDVPSVGLSQRLEGLSDADGEALMGETAQDTADETEPVEKPETGTKRGNRIGWWW